MNSSSLPTLSSRAAVKQVNFIDATLHDGWCLATQNTLEGVLLGNHDYSLAVTPDGSYATLHWTSVGKELSCLQVGIGGIDCFGLFEAAFPPPIRSLPDFVRPFREVLPILREAHQLWKSSPRLFDSGEFPISVTGDFARDVRILTATKKANEVVELTSIMKAIYEILRSKELSSRSMETLTQGMSSPFDSVWKRSSRMLIALSDHFPEAGEALLACMNHKKAATRLQTVQSIFCERPRLDLTARILSRGLKDSSKRVREFSADRIELFRLRDMLPEVEAAIDAERDPRSASQLKRCRSLLKFGVAVEQVGSRDEFSVTVRRVDGGWASTSPILRSHLNEKVVQQSVARHNGDLGLFQAWSMHEILLSP